MNKQAILIILALLLSTFNTQAGIVEHCESKYAGEFKMIKYCLKKAHSSMTEIKNFMKQYNLTSENWISKSNTGFVPAVIYKNCNDKYFDAEEINLKAYCLKTEESAARDLGKIGGSAADSYIFEEGIMGKVAALGVTLDFLQRYGLRINDRIEGIDVEVAASEGNKAALIYMECKKAHGKDSRNLARCLLTKEESTN